MYRLRVLAPRRVAVGRLGTSPAVLTAQTVAAAGHDPDLGLGRLRIDGVGAFSNGGPIGQIHFGVGCAPPLSPTRASHPVRSGLSPDTGPCHPEPQSGASVSSELLGSGLLLGDRPGPAQATARSIRVTVRTRQ